MILVSWPVVNLFLQFDEIIMTQLTEQVKSRLTLKGHLDTYKGIDDVWTFIVKNVNFKTDEEGTIHADKIKIVACNSRRSNENQMDY